MKKILAIFIMCTISLGSAMAQFYPSGKIEYVRTMNNHMSMKLEMEDELKNTGMKIDDILKMIPKNSTKIYSMTFDQEKSFYKFEKDGPEKMMSFGMKDPASENIVAMEFKNNKYIAQKEVIDNTFLINDTLPAYTWKISNEMRQIAGFNCRKATTTILDSVVVVAYYCDEIMVSGGPESFNGLPGMILGIAIPRLYTTWFATKVESADYDPKMEKSFQDKKVKKVNNEELIKTLQPSLSDWGKWGTQLLYKVVV